MDNKRTRRCNKIYSISPFLFSFVLSGGANNSSDTESLPSPHSSEDSKAKEEGSGRSKASANSGDKEASASDAGQAGDEKPPVKEDADAAIKQEIKTETGESNKEQLQSAAPSDATDKKPPTAETEDVKSSSKSSKRDHGAKTGSHGDSDSRTRSAVQFHFFSCFLSIPLS